MLVHDVIAACEYIGCEVVDFWGEPLEFDGNILKLYKKTVEHLEAKGNVIYIYTFDNIDKEGKTER